jgi:protein-S-isoprenylcysteine O-methyltransferase Ste14
METRRGIPPAVRVWSGIGLAVVGLAVARPTGLGLLIGTACVGYGLLWRIWASGYIEKGTAVTTAGPYRLHRHPLYWGTFWLGVGWAAMVGWLWFWAVFLGYYAVVYGWTVRQEEADLRERFGTAYASYAARTPRWLPLRRSVERAGPSASWSWARVRAHREHRTVLAVLVGTLLFWLRWKLAV